VLNKISIAVIYLVILLSIETKADQIWFSKGGFANVNGNQIWFSDGSFANISGGGGGLLTSIIALNQYNDKNELQQKLKQINEQNQKIENEIAQLEKRKEQEYEKNINMLCYKNAEEVVKKYCEVKAILIYDPDAINYKKQINDLVRQNPLLALKTLQEISEQLDIVISRAKTDARMAAKQKADELLKQDTILGKIKKALFSANQENNNISREMMETIKKAENGDVTSQLLLAYSYEQGINLPKDSGRHLFWLRKAANSNDWNAKLLLAYDSEEHGEYNESFKILSLLYRLKPSEIKAEHYRDIERSLGKAYFAGQGVQQNKAYGMWYFERAATSGQYVDKVMLEMAKKDCSKKSETPPEQGGLFDDILNEEQKSGSANSSAKK
jgi:TPR repeat protein